MDGLSVSESRGPIPLPAFCQPYDRALALQCRRSTVRLTCSAGNEVLHKLRRRPAYEACTSTAVIDNYSSCCSSSTDRRESSAEWRRRQLQTISIQPATP